MKKVLTNVIYPDGAYAHIRQIDDPDSTEMPIPVEGLGERLLEFDADARDGGRDWPTVAHTMVGRRRLDNVHECLERILADDVPGDVIETGVWRGGVCIFMRAFLVAHGCTDRTVWVADSFAGLPPAGDRDPDPVAAMGHDVATVNERMLAVDLAQVQENFDRYGLLDDQVRFLPGWFSDTLPTAPIERLSLLRLDGDWYDSTMDALVNLYPRLSSGGFVIIDDYCVPGCADAVTDYRAQHGIDAEIIDIDRMGVYWRKP
ncbi:macrocin O-methyltransferase (plasmid) [Pseudonocardia sp. HH130630-07]|nr:macrocin O-methyltransferase [Pseudonocardia sp. HH130630-07]